MGQEKGASPVGQFHSANAHWAGSNRLCAESCRAVAHSLGFTFPWGLVKGDVTRTGLKASVCSSFAHSQATLKCIYLGMHLWWRHHACSAVPPSSWQPKVTPLPTNWHLSTSPSRRRKLPGTKTMLFPFSVSYACFLHRWSKVLEIGCLDGGEIFSLHTYLGGSRALIISLNPSLSINKEHVTLPQGLVDRV